MSVFALLDRLATTVRGVEQLTRQTADHGLLATLAGGVDQPADGEGLLTLGAHFHGDLIGRTTDAARTHFDGGTDIFERAMEHLDRVLLGPLLDDLEGAIDDAFGGRLLAVLHKRVHEFGYDEITELGIGVDLTLFCTMPTGHGSEISLFRPLRAVLGPA